MSMLEKAIELAVRAHVGQVDKAGEPYVLHPLRVMLAVSGGEERIVGVLHDVVEDTAWTLDALRAEGFSRRVIEALDSVTRRQGEDYMVFVRRAAADAIGRQVKLADLLDNCNLARIAHPTDEDLKRIDRYKEAIKIIQATSSDSGC